MKLVDLQEARYAFAGKSIDDYSPGDKILMTHLTLRGIDKRAAEVSTVNHNDLGLVSFTPDYISKHLSSGYGSFDPKKLGKKKYGLVRVEIVHKRLPLKKRI